MIIRIAAAGRPLSSHSRRRFVSNSSGSTRVAKGYVSSDPFEIVQGPAEWHEKNREFDRVNSRAPIEEGLASDIKANVTSFSRFFRLLMPKDYEQTTVSTYESYAKLTMMSSMMGTAASVLSTQAMLSSVGVASESLIPLAATINWVLKDGLGQLGGVLFASYVNTRFDSDPKRFRFGADVCLALSVVVESCTAVLPWLFLPLASVANIGKNAAWITASATRASIHQSFCLEHNLADVTGKAGSQTTTASLVGTALGITLSPLLAMDSLTLIGSTIALSGFHLLASYRALHFVQLRFLNIQRAWLCLSPALISFSYKDVHNQSSLAAADWSKLETPENVAKKERISHFGKWGSRAGRANLASPKTPVRKDEKDQDSALSTIRNLLSVQPYLPTSIEVNPPFVDVSPEVLRNHLLPTCRAFADEHLVNVINKGGGNFTVQVFYLQDATHANVLNGFLHAAFVVRALGRLSHVEAASNYDFHKLCYDVRSDMHQENSAMRFYYAVQDSGWDVKHIFIEDRKDRRLFIRHSREPLLTGGPIGSLPPPSASNPPSNIRSR